MTEDNVVAVEIHLAEIWALTEGEFAAPQEEHIEAALALCQDGKNLRTCGCSSAPSLSDEAWVRIGECPFCGKRAAA